MQLNRKLPIFFYTYILFTINYLQSTIGVKTTKNVRVKVYNGPKECGTENKVYKGSLVSIHYTATIDPSSETGKAGQKIDSSHDKGFAQQIMVGRGKVIKGLDIGLQGLCKGAHAILTIPPRLAYGNQAHGPLPGKATVRYDVEIIEVQPEPPNEFATIDANMDGRLSKQEAKEYFDLKENPVDIDALWKDEDKDEDGFVSWEEFTGSKGDGPPKKEEQNQYLTEEEEEDFDEVVSIFKQIDTDSDLIVSKKEMSTFLKASGQNMETDEVWNSMDLNSDGKIDWNEFLQRHFLEKQKILQMQEEQKKEQKINKNYEKENKQQDGQEEIIASFNKLDSDKDGRLTRKELSRLFIEANLELTEQFWQESDSNSDGYISFQEFFGGSNKNNKKDKDEL